MGLVRFFLDPRGRVSRKDFWLKLVLVGTLLLTFFESAEATYQSFRAGTGHVLLSFSFAIDFPFWSSIQDLTAETPFHSTFALLWFWPPVAISVKRLHDLGYSAWWLAAYVGLGVGIQVIANFGVAFGVLQSAGGSLGPLWYFLAGLSFMGLIATLGLGVLRGQRGPNSYGPDPLLNQADGRNPEAAVERPLVEDTV